MSVYDIVGGRTVGEWGLSVGTALAIQSALGYSIDLPGQPNQGPVLIKDFNWLLINIRTLCRNLVNSCDNKMKHLLDPRIVGNAINTEMNAITEQLSMRNDHTCKPMFYVGSYDNLPKRFPHAILKAAGTAWQEQYLKLESNAIRTVLAIPSNHEIMLIDSSFVGNNPSSLIVTHLPVDLLSRYRFSNLVLLESHTGKTKKHVEWTSKLTNGKTLTRIPFNQFSLQLFGDGGNYFAGYNPKTKSYVLEVAEKGLWTPATTTEKQKNDIKTHIYNPILVQQLLNLF